jgi:sulfoacetaldehyde acetyltransferase
VRDPTRIAEVLNRVIENAWRGSAPAQINVPRDYWTQVIDIDLPQVVRLERSPGGSEAIAEAAALLSSAKFPVILNGAGVVIGGAIEASKQLAERLDAPVCCNARARHPAKPVFDAARLRYRLLAEERQNHPGRH